MSSVGDLKKTKWIYIVATVFILLNSVAVYFEQFWVSAIPLAVLIIWAAFFKLDILYLFIVFCTPASLSLSAIDVGGGGLYLPTEPLLFGVLLVFIFKLLSGNSIDRRIYKHPISIVIYVYLIWLFITSVTSEMPLVSFKFLLSKMWFIVPAFFVGAHIFKNLENIKRYFLLYLFPLFAVIIYTLIHHASYGFDKDAGHWVMDPFFKDHTSYGAVLAMYFPILIGLLSLKKMSALLRMVLILGFVILSVGLIFSFTRAAWVSLVVAAALMVLMFLKVRLRTLIGVFLVMGAIVWAGQDDILIMLEKNKQDSSDDLTEHVESMSNVSSDASNLERLNRWNCAFELFYERPFVGWGPGTYQFVYAPFQRSSDLTIISTNNADGGNAHSEYFGPLAEQGLPGTIIFVVLVIAVCQLGFRLFYTLENREMLTYVLICTLGLFTYFVHGTLNNYLDTDKASIPFWGFIGVLVAIDVFHNPKKESKELTA